MGTGWASTATSRHVTADAATARRAPVVAFTGGGTAGHVFPGIAIAEQLDLRVLWIGSADGVEGKLVRDAGIAFHGIPAGKLRRYFSLRNVTDIARVFAGVIASLRVLRREKPALLFSKGGFVSVPPVVAARLCRIPAFTHESDFDPGLATRINLRFCEKVFVSFADTVQFLPPRYRQKAVVTGNPVRSALLQGDRGKGRALAGCDSDLPLVLIMGGSLGSSFINSLVAAASPRLVEACFLVHQTGEKDFLPSTRRGYFTTPFLSDGLPDIMAAADLVVSRSGANTLAELAALGKPMVLVPLPASGSRGDQLRNAEVFSAAGAAVVLREEKTTPETFLSEVLSLLTNPQRLSQMAEKARTMSRGAPARDIARLIRERVS